MPVGCSFPTKINSLNGNLLDGVGESSEEIALVFIYGLFWFPADSKGAGERASKLKLTLPSRKEDIENSSVFVQFDFLRNSWNIYQTILIKLLFSYTWSKLEYLIFEACAISTIL